jgi:predicted ATPase
MYFDNPLNIPNDLLNLHDHEEDISILIGENGSGKSSMLNEVAKHFVARGASKVIAIANTIHDKFSSRAKNFEALKASSGKTIVKKTLKAALKMLAETDNSRFNDIGRTLEYIHFDATIGLRVTNVNPQFADIIYESQLERRLQEQLISVLERFAVRGLGEDEIQRINLYKSNFYDLRDSYLVEILRFEKELKSLKIIREVEVFLSRNNQFIPINGGSSGELTLITSLIYLMITITRGAVILIDEPENSLHPKWQTEYVKTLADLLYRYQPKIIIATHSPLIINSAEITADRVKIYKGTQGAFNLVKNDVYSVEEVYQDFFDVTTPENRFLSQDVAKKMNQLAFGDINILEFEQIINDFSNNSYDEKQKDVLSGVIEMGRKIIANK